MHGAEPKQVINIIHSSFQVVEDIQLSKYIGETYDKLLLCK